MEYDFPQERMRGHMIDRYPFEPDRSEASFRLMSNVMDLASAAANCVHAIKSTPGFFRIVTLDPRYQAMLDASRFVDRVKSLPGTLRDNGGAPYATDLMSLKHWRLTHSEKLREAAALRDGLGQLPETCSGEAAEHLGRLIERIEDGKRLMAA